MNLTLILLLISFFSIWVLITTWIKTDGWRISFLLTVLGCNLYLVFITEILSLFSKLNILFISIFWAIPILVLGSMLLTSKLRKRIHLPKIALNSLTWSQAILIATISLILLTLGFTAFFAPPNTPDVLNYHMPRVMHWIQNQSVRHYPTGIEFQNSYPPGAEYQILHLAILAGSDRWVNFAAWFTLVAATICVSLFAKLLKMRKTGQLLTSLFLVTLPGAILQAATAKNDLHVAFWVLFVLTFTILYFYQDKSPISLIAIFFGIGIGFLTKANTIIFLIPILIWLAISFVKQKGLKKSIIWGLTATLLFTIVNSGFLIRNLQTYGTPIDTYQSGRMMNEWISPRGILSNLIRNTCFNLQLPLPEVREAIWVFFLKVHVKLGIDINDPRTTSEGYFVILDMNTHENFSGNTFHALLLMPLAVIYFFQVKRRKPPLLFFSPIIFSISGFTLFSTLLKWQIFGARYFLPVFFIAAPIFGGVLERIKLKIIHGLIPLVMLVSSWPWLLSAEIRPLVSETKYTNSLSILTTKRIELLLGSREEGYPGLMQLPVIAKEIGCNDIGIYGGGGTTEYQIWVALNAPFSGYHLEWIVAGTPSAAYADPDFTPCLIVCHDCPAEQYRIKTFGRFFDGNRFDLYKP